MKKIISVLLALTLLCAIGALCVNAVEYDAKTVDYTSTLVSGCGTVGSYDAAKNSITLGQDAAGDNYATTGVYVPAGTRATVSVNFKFNNYRDNMGGGIFFDPRSDIAARNSIGGGTGFLAWTGSNFSNLQTWTWCDDFKPVNGDDWRDATAVIDKTNVNVVYNLTAELYEDNTAKFTLKNTATNATLTFKDDDSFPIVNNKGVYVGVFMLNGNGTFSDFKVTTYNPIYAGTYYPVCGTWTYDEATKTLTGGTENVGDNYIGTTKYFVEAGKRATVSVDFKFDAVGNGCGAGLFFDALSKDERTGLGGGTGVLNWMGSDFSQFKTWNWNVGNLGTDPDFWNPVENIKSDDTTTVYTVKAEFYEDGTAEFSITNKTTGATHVLQNEKIAFKNTNGCYVGLMTLNCKASFTNLSVKTVDNSGSATDSGTDSGALPPNTSDAYLAVAVLGVIVASSAVVMKKKKNG